MWKTLRPTYRLLIGVPGKSNAFAISSKLGLPDFIIERAKDQISQKDESFEDVLTSLENSRVIIENERQEAERYKNPDCFPETGVRVQAGEAGRT